MLRATLTQSASHVPRTRRPGLPVCLGQVRTSSNNSWVIRAKGIFSFGKRRQPLCDVAPPAQRQSEFDLRRCAHAGRPVELLVLAQPSGWRIELLTSQNDDNPAIGVPGDGLGQEGLQLALLRL